MINKDGNESKTIFEAHLLQRVEMLKNALHKAERILYKNKLNSDFISDTFNVINSEDNISK